MEYRAYYEYLTNNGAGLFTIVLLPYAEGKFPTIIFRSPYVDSKGIAARH